MRELPMTVTGHDERGDVHRAATDSSAIVGREALWPRAKAPCTLVGWVTAMPPECDPAPNIRDASRAIGYSYGADRHPNWQGRRTGSPQRWWATALGGKV